MKVELIINARYRDRFFFIGDVLDLNEAVAERLIKAEQARRYLVDEAYELFASETVKREEFLLAAEPIVLIKDGRVLATTTDPPHIRLYAWCLINLNTGLPRFIQKNLNKDLQITGTELKNAIDRLVKSGDLVEHGKFTGKMYTVNFRF